MNLEELKNISDCRLYEDIDLARFTTIRIHVKGSLVSISTIEALKKVILLLKKNNVRYHIVGLGANQVLINTKDVLFIKLDFSFNEEDITIKKLYFPASVTLARLSKLAKRMHLGGWEIFTGIPASLGGAIAMNAGTRLGEMKDLVKKVDVLTADGDLKTIEGEYLKFSYRNNLFLNAGDIIVGAELSFKEIDENIDKKIDEYLLYRSKTQPLSSKNCGCVFKNPSPLIPAGKVIDELGLKGEEYKGLKISEVHGNFIENIHDASALDFYDFVHEIKRIVKEKRGIEFEFEVKLI